MTRVTSQTWLMYGLVLLGLLAGCGGDLGVLHPDTILFNGKVVTVDEAFSVRRGRGHQGWTIRGGGEQP